MTRLFSLLLGVCLATSVQAQCSGVSLAEGLTEAERAAVNAQLDGLPYATGNHWIARKDDEELHLIGTVHLSDARLDGPTERLSPIVADAALLLLEMNAEDMDVMQQEITTDPAIFMLPDSSLPDLMPEEDWAKLSEAMEARGMPPFVGARMQPWYVSMLLSVPACMAAQLEQQDGLDARLEDAAEAAGVPTMSLEPYDTGLRLFAEIPMDIQLSMIRAALAPPDVNEDLFETLLSYYFAEDHAEGQLVLEAVSARLTALDPEENETVFRAMDDALIVQRNSNWLSVLLSALDDTEGPVVAAFGAAHLSGENGVLALLEGEGFALERAPF
ncbi:hypothetical protein GGQ68_000469 [Sagittula marina]|uniref:GumN family protein n=1 Tax=Sagittula marina TaxID=943940 RepID=A0A7W6DJH0_9RHOB|nr:TraB/GumN family protein [Sagittula marina]MBB3984158.1 hypothetical protein [Sagittula marina]